MPPEHGRRLAEVLPKGRLVEIADRYTLIPIDQPAPLARVIGDFVHESNRSAHRARQRAERRKERSMSVLVIWESRFPPEAATEGRRVTEAIWQDMPSFDGYRRHIVLQDLDEPGSHLFVVSEWESRAAADKVRDEYAEHRNAKRVESLVAEPRRRTVARAVDSSE